MKTLTPAFATAKNEPSRHAKVLVLLKLTLTDATVLRFAKNNSDVTYDGAVYLASEFGCDSIDGGRANRLDSATLRFCDIDFLLEPYMPHALTDTDLFTGGTATLITCDSALIADTSSSISMVFEIMASPGRDGYWKTLELAGDDPSKMRHPGGKFQNLSCEYVKNFKDFPCQYAGSVASCNGLYETCLILGNEANFGGFVGLDPDGLIVAVR